MSAGNDGTRERSEYSFEYSAISHSAISSGALRSGIIRVEPDRLGLQVNLTATQLLSPHCRCC